MTLESHLLPTASSVLDGIRRLHFHLLADGHAGAVIGQVGGPDGLDDSLVNPAHSALRTVGSAALRVVVGGFAAVSIGDAGGLFGVFGSVGEGRGVGDDACLLVSTKT